MFPEDDPAASRRRRVRTRYTKDQLKSMELVFTYNKFPDARSRAALSDAIGLSDSRIQVRFCYRIFLFI